MEVFHLNDLPHEQLVSSKTGEMFSKSAILTSFLSFQKLFVHHEILPPGKRASSAHYHTLQEEMILVLDGNPTAHLEPESRELKPGDFIGFKPNSKEQHYIENKTDQDVRFLVICSNEKEDQIIF